jgi:RNA polymerase sigma-70 factor (ECF subfamily)
MLGSRADARTSVQEAWLRGPPASGVGQPAAWLRTVVHRLCLDELRSARVRRESYVGPWLPEPVHTADGSLGPLDTAELRDTLSIGFLHLLERLSASERAVFVLREAFSLPYDEVAESVGRSVAACRQLHVRARGKLGTDVAAGRVPARRRLLDQLVLAIAAADIPSVTALLVDDAELVSDGGGVVSAARRPVEGADRIARFLVGVGPRVPSDADRRRRGGATARRACSSGWAARCDRCCRCRWPTGRVSVAADRQQSGEAVTPVRAVPSYG